MTQIYIEENINKTNITKEEAMILIESYYNRIEDLEDILAIKKYENWGYSFASKEKTEKVFKKLLNK